MILRRVIAHFRKQEWTAIAIDFVIVVLGVFVGLQVNNWNATRIARAEEQRLIAQLLNDVDRASTSKRAWVEEVKPRIETLQSALLAIQSDRPGLSLTEDQCTYVALSHIIVFESSSLPTLDEMMSTGGLGLISNARARRALAQYKSDLAVVRAAFAFIREDFANLIDNYGDAFARKYDPSNTNSPSPAPTTIECRMDAIRANLTLRNRIISNLARTRQLSILAEQEIKLLDQIETELRGAAK